MVNKNKKPVLTPALSSKEREKRLPRLVKMMARDWRSGWAEWTLPQIISVLAQNGLLALLRGGFGGCTFPPRWQQSVAVRGLLTVRWNKKS
jgi:hypothetical protein